MAKRLSAEVMWQAKQLYEEKWTEQDQAEWKGRAGERKWSMRQIAARLRISETSVLRAVTNTGRFAVLGNDALPEVPTDEIMEMKVAESVKKFQAILAGEKAEQTPGQTRADKAIAELEKIGPVSDNVKDRLKGYL